MTSTTRRALPWLLSLGAHAAFVAAAFFLLMAPRASLGPRVDISLVGGSGPGGGELSARPGTRTAAASRGVAPPARSSAKGSAPSSSPGHHGAAAQASAAFESAGLGSASPELFSFRASRASMASTPAPPSALEVLSDAESVSASGSGSATGSSAGADAATGSQAAGGAGPGGSPGPFAGGTEWRGLPRKLVRKRTPEFPALLSTLGQEVEVEARITVEPSGIVRRVEITRSSGYIEIDASVEAALRDYLFSRVDGRLDSTGTVKFRFRLEKQD